MPRSPRFGPPSPVPAPSRLLATHPPTRGGVTTRARHSKNGADLCSLGQTSTGERHAGAGEALSLASSDDGLNEVGSGVGDDANASGFPSVIWPPRQVRGVTRLPRVCSRFAPPRLLHNSEVGIANVEHSWRSSGARDRELSGRGRLRSPTPARVHQPPGSHRSWLGSRAWIQPVPLLGLARATDGRGASGRCRLVTPGRVVDEHHVPRSHQPLEGVGNCTGRPSELPGDLGRTAGNGGRGHQLGKDQLGQLTSPETPGGGPLRLVVE